MTDFQYLYKAHCTAAYDGDTITVDIDLGFNSWMRDQKIRLFGIDTPELRGEERPEGLVSRDRVLELILDRDVELESIRDRSGKYGRWLGIITFLNEEGETINLNALLVKEGLAEWRTY